MTDKVTTIYSPKFFREHKSCAKIMQLYPYYEMIQLTAIWLKKVWTVFLPAISHSYLLKTLQSWQAQNLGPHDTHIDPRLFIWRLMKIFSYCVHMQADFSRIQFPSGGAHIYINNGTCKDSAGYIFQNEAHMKEIYLRTSVPRKILISLYECVCVCVCDISGI